MDVNFSQLQSPGCEANNKARLLLAQEKVANVFPWL